MTDSSPTSESFLGARPNVSLPLLLITYLGLSFLERMPFKALGALLCFLSLGFVALYLAPRVLGLPTSRKSFRAYCEEIRLLPVNPLGRNILLGLGLSLLSLGAILLATALTGHLQFDWAQVPALRWLKGLTRGLWEEVFFRGILLILFLRQYKGKQGQAIFWNTFVFAILHFQQPSIEGAVDTLSIFFMGLLFTYTVLKTGSQLPAIVFHYVHDIFVNFVQQAPGADHVKHLIMIFGFLWLSYILGALLVKVVVERWPGERLD